jgi:hypothetical protein
VASAQQPNLAGNPAPPRDGLFLSKGSIEIVKQSKIRSPDTAPADVITSLGPTARFVAPATPAA